MLARTRSSDPSISRTAAWALLNSARDPKRFRVFVVVSRQALIDSRFSTIICAPVYSTRHGLATQVDVGLNEGLRHDSSVHCDELVSLRKSQLTQFVGTFDATKLKCLDDALMVALGLLRSQRELAAGAIVSARTPSADRNPVVRVDAAIRSASGAHVQHGGTLHPAPAGLPCSMNWFSLFFTENSLFDQTNSLFRGVGNSKLKPHDISGLGGFDPAYSRPNPQNSLFFPC